MRAGSEGADLVEGQVEMNPLLVEDMEYKGIRRSFGMPNRQLWSWIFHSILFSAALVIIYMNHRTETDCIQKLSYYCTSSSFLFRNIMGLIKALYQPQLSSLSTKTTEFYASTTRIIPSAVRPPKASARLGID